MKRPLFIFVLLFAGLVGALAQHSALRKLSPSVRQLLLRDQSYETRASQKGDRQLCAFVKTNDDARQLFDSLRCQSLAEFGDIHIVSIPLSNLCRLASDRRISRIEAGMGTNVCNDQMLTAINTAPVYEGNSLPQAYTGEGVVMGIQDIGFDLTNPNFYSLDMEDYRIRRLWDMLAEDTAESQLYVGNEYVTREQLLAYQHSRDGQKLMHGTHTLGTAAGSGAGTRYQGVATGADICLVSNAVSSDLEFINEEDRAKYTYATDALGFKYIFDYAQRVGKPCVISFSEGSRQDLYGDDLLYYEVLHELVGPGRIIVSSAGNNGVSPSYLHKTAAETSAGTFITATDYAYCMMEGDGEFSVRVKVYDEDQPTTITVSSDWICQQPDSLLYDTLAVSGQSYSLIFGAYPSCYRPENLVVELYIDGPSQIGSNPCVSVEMVGQGTDVQLYKLVGDFAENELDESLTGAECVRDINSPSSSPDVICVGATAYKRGYENIHGETMVHDWGTGGERAGFSSVGPTLDNRIKPDVMAPGTNVVSSASSFFMQANPKSYYQRCIVEEVEFGDRTYPFVGDNGTSMSSPAVAGVIALWLQAKPDLTREDIIDVFAQTCRRPESSSEYPNNQFGYGEIDAYRGLLYLLGVQGVEDVSQHATNAQVRVLDGQLLVSFDAPLTSLATITIFSLSGQKLSQQTVCTGSSCATISLSPFAPQAKGSVLLLQIDSPDTKLQGSQLIRP